MTPGRSETPSNDWHDLPDRTDDPQIKRSIFHRGVIRLAKRGTKGRSYQFLRVVSIDRRLFRPFLLWNARLMPRGKLSRKQTEAVIVRVAWLVRSKYEWTQHRAIAKAAGLTSDQVAAAASDPTNEVLDEPTRALLAAVPELLDGHALAEATFNNLAEHFTHAQILEFVMLVGNYAMLAGALNTFGVPIEEAWQK